MKRNLKKGMCAVVLAAMLATSVTACGGKKADSTEAATTTETTAAESKAEETTSEEAKTEAAETEKKETEAKADALEGSLTEEEYLNKTEELAQTMTDTMTKAQEDLAKLEADDVDGAKALIEGMKAPFVEFAAVQAPEKYAAAQAKYKSGCEAMVEYLDILLDTMEMSASGKTPSQEETQKLVEDMTNAITTAHNDLTEAGNLLIEAAGSELVEETSAAETSAEAK